MLCLCVLLSQSVKELKHLFDFDLESEAKLDYLLHRRLIIVQNVILSSACCYQPETRECRR